MASPARMDTIDEPALIEEQVDTGLKPMLENYRSAHPLGPETKDELNKRFLLFPNKPLPRLSHAYAQAFQAQDLQNPERFLYAMVLDNKMPYRQQAMTELQGMNSQYTVTLFGSGPVLCSHLGEVRMVLFIEQPQGTVLADAIAAQGRLHEHRVVDYVLGPAIRALAQMRDRKVSHGNISPAAFYLGETPMLGECVSAPCGSLTHYLYEAPERINAEPAGRGEANEKSDAYALGVLAFELIYGLDKIKDMGRDEFLKLTLNIGTYNVFATGREFSDMYNDFFRGVFTDNPTERWGLDQLMQWLGGKRFNMIAPSTNSQASRAFTFMEENYFSRRLLAYMFHKYWRDTAKEIKSLRLERWAEMSLHNPEMADRIERALRIAGNASTERHVNDMMTRIIAILDPTGPLRSLSLSVRPDGVGALLAQLANDNASTELNQLLALVENDAANYWADLDSFNKAYDQSQVLWRLQRVRPHLKSNALGFGLERVLYELNPSLPCQSDLLRQYHITTTQDVLKALDALAKNLGPDTSFMDRHLIAFIATKIDMGKEVKLLDLSTIPALANSPELVALKIIAKAQQKYERLQLTGLTTWAAMRVEKMLDEIHNRTMRRDLKKQLRRLASSGSLNDVLSAVVNRDMALRDHEGFANAIALHQINHLKIERFRNPALVHQQAEDMGGRLSSLLSGTICMITFIVVLLNVLGM